MSIVETVSMRLEGHSLADPAARYVPAAQLARGRAKDPLLRFRAQLLAADMASPDELTRIEQRVVEEVRAAAREAEGGAMPQPSISSGPFFAVT